MTISGPKQATDHPDRGINCQEAIERSVIEAFDEAVQAGWRPREVLDALAEVVANLTMAYKEDPDPADDD